MKIPRQCAILVGGLGTRLGSLTADTPKPLLDCGGRPFLAWVLRELSRFGITDIVLLAGYKSERTESFCRAAASWLPKPLSISVSVEPSPAGTGGALWHARHLLEDTFLVINGDSWIDVNLARFFARAAAPPEMAGSVLLRSMPDCSRYGRVELEGERIVALHEKSPLSGPGLINGGLYIFDRSVLAQLSPLCSLEREILPALAREGRLSGCVLDGYFIDIGIPSDYERAGVELPRRLLRPAIVFEAGVLLDQPDSLAEGQDRIPWKPGAVDAIRMANDSGIHAFLVAARTGDSCAEISGEDLKELSSRVNNDLLAYGATIDEMQIVAAPDRIPECFSEASARPEPTIDMLLDLARRWGVDPKCRVLIGERTMANGANLGAPAHFSEGGNIMDLARPLIFELDRQRTDELRQAGSSR